MNFDPFAPLWTEESLAKAAKFAADRRAKRDEPIKPYALTAEDHESLEIFCDPELQLLDDSDDLALAIHRARALWIFRRAERIILQGERTAASSA